MVKRVIGALVVALVAATGIVVVAPTASAATAIDCTAAGVNNVAITVAAGATETFAFTGVCAGLTTRQYATGSATRGSIYATTNAQFAGTCTQDNIAGTQWSCPANQIKTIQGTFNTDTLTSVVYTAPSTAGTDYFFIMGNTGTKFWSVSITVAGGSSNAGDTPPPWLQAYGRHQADTCRVGWHPSWAEWAVDKTGGWVCERTIMWDGTTWIQNRDAVWGTYDPSLNSPWSGD